MAVEAWVRAQWNMWVTGSRTWYVAALLRGLNFYEYRTEYDEIVTERQIVPAASAFDEHVQEGTPPPPDESDHFAVYLRERFPAPDPDVVKASPKLMSHVQEWHRLHRKEAKLKRDKTLVQNIVRNAMGAHETLRTDLGEITDCCAALDFLEPLAHRRVVRYLWDKYVNAAIAEVGPLEDGPDDNERLPHPDPRELARKRLGG